MSYNWSVGMLVFSKDRLEIHISMIWNWEKKSKNEWNLHAVGKHTKRENDGEKERGKDFLVVWTPMKNKRVKDMNGKISPDDLSKNTSKDG